MSTSNDGCFNLGGRKPGSERDILIVHNYDLKVFLTTGNKTEKHKDDIQNLSGYKVLLQDGNLLGVITEVISNPGQLILNVISENNRDMLIPLHEDFIVKVDKRKKILVMDIPEGLTEIN